MQGVPKKNLYDFKYLFKNINRSSAKVVTKTDKITEGFFLQNVSSNRWAAKHINDYKGFFYTKTAEHLKKVQFMEIKSHTQRKFRTIDVDRNQSIYEHG